MDPKDHLIECYSSERHALTSLLASRLVSPLLRSGLTANQLKIVLLVTSDLAQTGRDLAEALDVTAASVSTSVDKLVALGYLDRANDTLDRRVTHLIPTEKATRIHDQLLDGHGAWEQYLSLMPVDDLDALVRGLSALRRVVEAEHKSGSSAPASDVTTSPVRRQ